jgi:general secretion pathway protein J
VTTPLRSRGFTLLEVMIAVAITAGMGLMMLGTFSQVDRAREMTQDQGDRYAGARLALSRLSRELSMAFISDHFDKNRLRDRPSAFVGRDDQILFTTFAHERLGRDVRESDQEAVEYTLETDPDHSGERALFRRSKAHIDEEIDRGGRKDLVADHLTAFRLLYFDPRKNDWVRDWSTKSVDRQNALPSRVRIELELAVAAGRGGDRTVKLSTEARIALTRNLDF